MNVLLLISGPMAAGKSTLARALIEMYGFYAIHTRGHLETIARDRGIESNRTMLQDLGDKLDEETDYRWVSDWASAAIGGRPNVQFWLLDSVRKPRQVDHLRALFSERVFHVHGYAPEAVLKARFDERRARGDFVDAQQTYEKAILHPNEIAARSLNDLANLAIDLSTSSSEEAAASIVRATGAIRAIEPRDIILLSGRTGAGKTSLGHALDHQFEFELIRTSAALLTPATETTDRLDLQAAGDTRDTETKHGWVFDLVSDQHAFLAPGVPIVVDNIRNSDQLARFRRRRDWKVTHVHLYAPNTVLEARFKEKRGARPTETAPDYKAADLIKREADIDAFKQDADIRVNTEHSDVGDTAVRIGARLGAFAAPDIRCVDVLVGGQFGSEGKGNIAAYLAPEYEVLVRVGGPNAGHTVASASGLFTYHQLPSGARDTRAKLLLGPGMTIQVDDLLAEIKECGITPDRLFIDPQATIIEKEDIRAEQGIKGAIASTARGSGAATARRIRRRKPGAVRLAKDIKALRPFVGTAEPYRGCTLMQLERAYKSGASILLEGTQGSGLSLFHGIYPYVTSRDTNVAGCLAEAGISPSRIRRIMMVVRTTPIRVANPDSDEPDPAKRPTSGPLKHLTTFEEIAARAGLDPAEVRNAEKTSTTKRDRRVGWFDWELLRRSCALNAPTDIVLTFADYLSAANAKARRYEQLDRDTKDFIEEIERVAQAPVSLINVRFPRTPTAGADLRTVIDRRNWRGRPPRAR